MSKRKQTTASHIGTGVAIGLTVATMTGGATSVGAEEVAPTEPKVSEVVEPSVEPATETPKETEIPKQGDDPINKPGGALETPTEKPAEEKPVEDNKPAESIAEGEKPKEGASTEKPADENKPADTPKEETPKEETPKVDEPKPTEGTQPSETPAPAKGTPSTDTLTETPAPSEGEKPKEDDPTTGNEGTPTEGEKPKEENPVPATPSNPTEGEKPKEKQPSNPSEGSDTPSNPAEGEKPKDETPANLSEPTNPPADGGETPTEPTNPPSEGEKPKKEKPSNPSEPTTPPTDGDKPKEENPVTPPTNGEKPKDENPSQPTTPSEGTPGEGEKPKDGEKTGEGDKPKEETPKDGDKTADGKKPKDEKPAEKPKVSLNFTIGDKTISATEGEEPKDLEVNDTNKFQGKLNNADTDQVKYVQVLPDGTEIPVDGDILPTDSKLVAKYVDKDGVSHDLIVANIVSNKRYNLDLAKTDDGKLSISSNEKQYLTGDAPIVTYTIKEGDTVLGTVEVKEGKKLGVFDFADKLSEGTHTLTVEGVSKYGIKSVGAFVVEVPKKETPKPEEPSTPSEPTEHSKPSEPTEPSKPGEPAQPTPSEPSKPSEPSEPAKPNEPETPAQPEKPSEPAKPETPSEPEKPVEDNKPAPTPAPAPAPEPEKPVVPADPAPAPAPEPEKPVTPVAPVAPVNPILPPVELEKPVAPVPSITDNNLLPSNPTDIITPEKPVTPEPPKEEPKVEAPIVREAPKGISDITVGGNSLYGDQSKNSAVATNGDTTTFTTADSLDLRVSVDTRVVDTSRTEIKLIGRAQGELNSSDFVELHDGTYRLKGIAKDDYYTLYIRTYDSNGKLVSDTTENFSINKNGSSYSIVNEGLEGHSFKSLSSNVRLVESNVDKINSDKTTIKVFRDGKEISVPAGAIRVSRTGGVNGNWEYTYSIDKSYFEEDGVYTLEVFSQTETGVKYSSSSRTIQFIIDNKAPQIVITGIRDGGRYRSNEKRITIDVRDISKIKSIKAYLNGKEVKVLYDEKTGLYYYDMKSTGQDRNEFVVEVEDEAGNLATVSVKNFLLSSDLAFSIFNDDNLLYLLGGVGTAVVGFLALLGFRRKRKLDEEDRLAFEQAELLAASHSSANGTNQPVTDFVEDGNSSDRIRVEDLVTVSTQDTPEVEEDEFFEEPFDTPEEADALNIVEGIAATTVLAEEEEGLAKTDVLLEDEEVLAKTDVLTEPEDEELAKTDVLTEEDELPQTDILTETDEELPQTDVLKDETLAEETTKQDKPETKKKRNKRK